MFERLDGTKRGLLNFTGYICKSLKYCQFHPFVLFKKISFSSQEVTNNKILSNGSIIFSVWNVSEPIENLLSNKCYTKSLYTCMVSN